eukprot:1040707-Heterocapsa_arctica.AAC.1
MTRRKYKLPDRQDRGKHKAFQRTKSSTEDYKETSGNEWDTKSHMYFERLDNDYRKDLNRSLAWGKKGETVDWTGAANTIKGGKLFPVELERRQTQDCSS